MRSTTIAPMESPQDVEMKKGSSSVVEGPEGGKVLKFDGEFQARIDLASRGINIKEFDLLKVQIKADRGAVLHFQLENFPNRGDISNWWVLDSQRGAFDWKTLWVDLSSIETIKEAGDEKQSWLESETKGKHSVLNVNGSVKELKSKEQGPGRRIWIGDIRAVKKAVHLDWDQSEVSYRGGTDGEDLVYTYPLTVTNKLDRPVTSELSLEPFDVDEASASLEKERVKLKSGETKTIRAEVSLPASVTQKKDPLYCERFTAYAKAKGIQDSRVTILRSADPIHLTVTVPVPEERLQFPIFPKPSNLPDQLTNFQKNLAREKANAPADELIKNAMKNGIYNYGSEYVRGFIQTLVSSAYLYDFTGKEKYLKKASDLLAALPRIWAKFYREWEQKPFHEISSGIVARWNDDNHYTLGLGWRVMGTQRSPYLYHGNNAGAGGASSIAYAFDILANDLDRKVRQKFINGFLVPAGIQCRNHYIGDGNQQATANAVAMYAGLASRNWPLVSFAYSSEHGLKSIVKWSFDDDGIQLRKNYQTYTLRPIFWMGEMLYGVGFNYYKKYEDRLTQLVNADPRKKDMGSPLSDRYFWEFIDKNRLDQ